MTKLEDKMPKLATMLDYIRKEEDLTVLLAELRDEFLDIEAISKENGYDIVPEVASCPHHVILYTAIYIEMLKSKNNDKPKTERCEHRQ